MGTRSDFVGKKKGVCVGLGLRMQESHQTSCHKRSMVSPHNNYYYNHHDESQLSSSSSSWENTSGGDCGAGGSMFCNTSNQVAWMGDIYDVVGAASGSGSGTTNTAVLVSKSLNPSNTTDSSLFPFNSSVGDQMAAASMNLNARMPFTAAQLRELERQTMIYKYMMASVPVPHELILPITKTPSRAPHSQSNSNFSLCLYMRLFAGSLTRVLFVMVQGSMELGLLSNNNSDPEPWRCRRTDGKKWRCSRDVVPEQKYCERHSHKSRPRSRKPVEVPAHLNKNDHQTLKHSLNLSSSKSQFVNQTMLSSMASPDEQPRCLEWFMKGQTVPVASNSNQEWHQKHLINSSSCINLGGGDQILTLQAHQRLVQDQYGLLLGPKLVSHQEPTQETRHFIDAWSIAEENSGHERLPLSSLALSMSGGSGIIERNEDALMGSHGIMGSEREIAGTLKPHWMNHDSPPGGPLAEALCLGIASSTKLDSNAASPHGGCSTSTTTSSKSSCGGDGGRGFNFTN